jgi:NADH:ubiquinone oxidoreductase subunit 2 (subunit N)
MGWAGEGLLPHEQPLTSERLVIGAAGLASLVLGAVAALLHDDLEHVVGYSLVSDAGVLLLALASLDPDGWAAARSWILVYVCARSAFAGWATAVTLTYESRQIPALAGWARRSPLLAGSLVVIAATVVGVPGLPAFEARSQLATLALEPPLDLLASAGILASAGYFGRLLIVGFRRPSTQVARAVDLQPAWPGDLPRRPSREVVGVVPAAVRRNRRPAAALAVFGLAMVGLAVAGGAFRGPALAAQPFPPAMETASPGSPVPSAAGDPAGPQP